MVLLLRPFMDCNISILFCQAFTGFERATRHRSAISPPTLPYQACPPALNQVPREIHVSANGQVIVISESDFRGMKIILPGTMFWSGGMEEWADANALKAFLYSAAQPEAVATNAHTNASAATQQNPKKIGLILVILLLLGLMGFVWREFGLNGKDRKGTAGGDIASQHRMIAASILAELRELDAAQVQYAIENNLTENSKIAPAVLRQYIKKNTRLYNAFNDPTGPKDELGNLFVITAVDEHPKVNPATFFELSDVADESYWTPFFSKQNSATPSNQAAPAPRTGEKLPQGSPNPNGDNKPKDFARYLKAAEQGDAAAQSNLGEMYYKGEGVPKDSVKAVEWYRKAANQGDARGQSSLGMMYAKGEGVPKDSVEALKWLRKGVEKGDARGQSNLGAMYDNGEGVPKDSAKAVEWYRKAAEQGYAAAQSNLGAKYENGEGVPKDFVKAVEWYRKAAEQGFAIAQTNLGGMYNRGEGVPKDFVKAVEWYRKAAEQGYAVAQHNLGVKYDNGEGVPKDSAKAVEWYRKAAEQGYAAAQFNLGVKYANGEGVPKDFVKAVEWYRKAAEQGDEEARAFLRNANLQTNSANKAAGSQSRKGIGEEFYAGSFKYRITKVRYTRFIESNSMDEAGKMIANALVQEVEKAFGTENPSGEKRIPENATYLIVEYQLTNEGNSPQTILTDNFKLRDLRGRTYTTSNEATIELVLKRDHDFLAKQLMPGIQYNSMQAFLVPKDIPKEEITLLIPTNRDDVEVSLGTQSAPAPSTDEKLPQGSPKPMAQAANSHGSADPDTVRGRYVRGVNQVIGSRWTLYVNDKRAGSLFAPGSVTLRFTLNAKGKVLKLQLLDNSSNAAHASLCERSFYDAQGDIQPPPPELLKNGVFEDTFTFTLY